MDVFDHAIVLVGAILLATVPGWVTARRNHRGIQDIKDQVVNGHKSPLRADLDKALNAINSLASDVTALRQDLLVERDSRKSQVDDLRSDVDRMRRR